MNPSLHERAEDWVARWGAFVARRRLAVVVLFALGTLALLPGLRALRTDNSIESYLGPGDRSLERYREFQEAFGQDQLVMVVVRAPELFQLSFLEQLRALHRALASEVPYVDDVTSLINARLTSAEGDLLIVGELLEDWPRDAAELAEVERRARTNPLYQRLLLNDAGDATALLVEPGARAGTSFEEALEFGDDGGGSTEKKPYMLSQDEQDALLVALDQVIGRFRDAGLDVSVAGRIPDVSYADRLLAHDVSVSLLGSLLINAAILWALFRRLSAVVLPILCALASVVATFSIMGLLGIPFANTSAILPRLLIVVAICNAIHILLLVYQQIDAGLDPGAAVAAALRHCGTAVVLCALTTAGGLVSFLSSGLAQFRQFGTIAPLGVGIALAYSMALLPALVAFSRAPRRGPEDHGLDAAVARLTQRVGGWAAARPYWVLAAAAALLLLSVTGIGRLRFSEYTLWWLPEDDPVRRSVERIDREFGGLESLELIVDTGRPEGLADPVLLENLEAGVGESLQLRVDGIQAGKAVSLLDILKEINQALHAGRSEAYTIAEDPQLIAQQLLLFESSGSDDLEEVADRDLRSARVSLRIPYVDAMLYSGYLDQVTAAMRRALGPDVGLEVTGLSDVRSRTFSLLSLTMARSYAWSMVVIGGLMILFLGNLRIGLLSMVPNVLPVVFVLGIMGWTGMTLNSSTLIIGSLMLGLVVDDTIHFLHRFHRTHAELGDTAAAIHDTLGTAGTAMVAQTAVLTLGFLVALSAYLVNVVQFGLLASAATLLAVIAELFVTPALLAMVFARKSPATGRAALDPAS